MADASASGGGANPPPSGGGGPGESRDKPWAGKTGKEKSRSRAAYFADKNAAAATNRAASGPARSQRRGPSANRGAHAPSRPHTGDQPLVETFRPGTYPILFATGHGHATYREYFTPRVGDLVELVGRICGIYERAPFWTTFRAELRQAMGIRTGANNAEERRFRCGMQAAAAVAFAQQISYSTSNAEGNSPHIPALLHANVSLPRCLIAIISQYGAFAVDTVGIRFQLPAPRETMLCAIRLAGELFPPVGEAFPTANIIDAAAQHWWLPTGRNCVQFRWIVAIGLQRTIADRCETEIDSRTIYETLFPAVPPPGDRPDWMVIWTGNVPDAEGRDLDFLFQPFPADEAAFHALFLGALGARRLAALRLEWDNSNVNHLQWNLQPAAIVQRVASGWAQFTLVARSFLTMSIYSDMRATARGSPAQISRVDTSIDDAVTTLNTFTSVQAATASLAVCFRPEALFDTVRYPCRVVFTSNGLVDEICVRWIQSDVAPQR